MAKFTKEDFEYMNTLSSVVKEKESHRIRVVLYLWAFALFSFIVWAYFAEIDEIARGKGEVVPSGNILNRNSGVSDEDFLVATKLSGVDEFARMHPHGYGMMIGERAQGLSGGQRQSIGIARALIADAPLMLLDEPTNALDQLSESRLIKYLSQSLSNAKTVLLVTQKLGLLSMTPRVIVMHEGQVYLDGKREDVLKKLQGVESHG